MTDTVGHVTRSWYDGANRLVSTTVNYSPTLSGHGPGNDWNLTTWYGYDPVGNQMAVTDTRGPRHTLVVRRRQPAGEHDGQLLADVVRATGRGTTGT